MSKSGIVRDERTVAVENSSYRWGYRILAFGLLVVIAYRAYVRQETNWDLFALILLSGGVTTVYQHWNRVLTLHWARIALASVAIAAAIAAVLVLVR